MLKIRLQGTTKDLKWFLKMLARDQQILIEKLETKGNFEAFEKRLIRL